MYRFTTPKHIFKFPEDIQPEDLADILITYSQAGEIVLEKHKSDLTIEDDNSVWFRFTQEDSAKFKPKIRTDVQLRILYATGESYASRIIQVEILAVLHDGVLGVQ